MAIDPAAGFVETSVHIASRTHADKATVKQKIRGFSPLATCLYVKMEFRRSAIASLVYVYNVMRETGHPGALLHRIQRLFRQQYKMAGSLLDLAQFFYDEGETEVSGPLAEVVSSTLVSWCRERLRQWWRTFARGMDVLDETGCVLAPDKLPMRGDVPAGMRRCNRGGVECRTVEFLEKHRESFARIAAALGAQPSLDEKQRELLDVLTEVLDNPQAVAEQRNCWRMADAIVAVACPEAAVLLTRDKHFNTLCPALDKAHEVT